MEIPRGILVPYHGEEPYIFLSYSHKNSEQAFALIKRLQEARYRVWYDEGIDPGTEWDENIAAHVQACGFFISLVSKEYLASSNCKDELNYARDLEKQRILVFLEDVQLPAGMKMRVSRLQSIHKFAYRDEDKFYDKLFESHGIEPCQEPLPEPEPEPEPEPAPKPVVQAAPAASAVPKAPQPAKAPETPRKPEPPQKPKPAPAQKSKSTGGLKNLPKWVWFAGGSAVVAVILLIVLLSGSGGKKSGSERLDATQSSKPTQAETQQSVQTEPQETDHSGEQTQGLLEIGLKEFQLEETGELAGDPKSFTFKKNYLAVEQDGKIALCDHTGKANDAALYSSITSIDLDNCLMVTAADVPGPNNRGLATSEGITILPCQYCGFKVLSSRFVAAYTADQQLENSEGSIFYSSDDGAYYTGTGRVFDLTTGKLLDNPQLTTAGEALRAFASHPCLQVSDGSLKIYDDTGSEVATVPKGSYSFTESAMIASSGGVNTVYGDDLQPLFAEKYLSVVSGMPDYFAAQRDDGRHLLNLSGEEVLSGVFKFINNVGLFTIHTETSSDSLLFAFDGRQLAKTDKNHSFSERAYGYCGTGKDGSYSIYGADGVKIEKLDTSLGSDLLLYRKNGSSYEVLILRNQDYTLKTPTAPIALAPGLAAVRGEDNLGYGVYDLINGTQLLPCQFDRVYYANGYIYAEQPGLGATTCKICKVTPVLYGS